MKTINYPLPILSAMQHACNLVDVDVEQTGTVSVAAVEAVREALALAKQHDAQVVQ